MVALAEARSERRIHSRLPGPRLIAEIRGKRYRVLDISFGGMKIEGYFPVGGLLDAIIVPVKGNGQFLEGKAEVRGRVERVEGELTAVRFSNSTPALARLIERP
jgi:hypothetical protein